jgi:hypothetical protein
LKLDQKSRCCFDDGTTPAQQTKEKSKSACSSANNAKGARKMVFVVITDDQILSSF